MLKLVFLSLLLLGTNAVKDSGPPHGFFGPHPPPPFGYKPVVIYVPAASSIGHGPPPPLPPLPPPPPLPQPMMNAINGTIHCNGCIFKTFNEAPQLPRLPPPPLGPRPRPHGPLDEYDSLHERGLPAYGRGFGHLPQSHGYDPRANIGSGLNRGPRADIPKPSDTYDSYPSNYDLNPSNYGSDAYNSHDTYPSNYGSDASNSHDTYPSKSKSPMFVDSYGLYPSDYGSDASNSHDTYPSKSESPMFVDSHGLYPSDYGPEASNSYHYTHSKSFV